MTKERVPPGQYVTENFPILHLGSPSEFDPEAWDFHIQGLVARPLCLSWAELKALPRTVSVSDFHCVTGWSRLDNRWEGVAFKALYELAQVQPEARFVTLWDHQLYSSSLPLADLLRDDVLLAYRHDGSDLAPEHGGPLRLVVPHRYAYKSVKWVRGMRFTAEQEMGFWEQRGYSNTADPWKEERYA
ncbi:MAG: sulfite oxidase-like oxidoreductase [Chloroflexi bacterium]|nr:sulfite oxidase-like oxidoreductase [Chloroflexota bacterium]